MGVFDGSRVLTGPGTLYAAPLGTAEPTSVTGAWPSAWVKLGYTDQGSVFNIQYTADDVPVEEEYWPVAKVTTKVAGSITFALAEYTAQNLTLALNGGIGTAQVSGTNGTNADGSLWVEPPGIGTDVRVMIGWDQLPQGATSPTGSNPTGRLIVRRAYQDGQMQIQRRKGANKATIACQFSLEKPAGVQPVRFLLPAILAA